MGVRGIVWENLLQAFCGVYYCNVLTCEKMGISTTVYRAPTVSARAGTACIDIVSNSKSDKA